MEWFLKLTPEVQIPIVGVLGAAVAVIGVIVRSRFASNPEKEGEYRPKPIEVRFSDADRALIDRHREAIDDHREAIDDHREQLIRIEPAGSKK